MYSRETLLWGLLWADIWCKCYRSRLGTWKRTHMATELICRSVKPSIQRNEYISRESFLPSLPRSNTLSLSINISINILCLSVWRVCVGVSGGWQSDFKPNSSLLLDSWEWPKMHCSSVGTHLPKVRFRLSDEHREETNKEICNRSIYRPRREKTRVKVEAKDTVNPAKKTLTTTDPPCSVVPTHRSGGGMPRQETWPGSPSASHY